MRAAEGGGGSHNFDKWGAMKSSANIIYCARRFLIKDQTKVFGERSN